MTAWPRFVTVVDDYGLTTGVSAYSALRYWRQHGVLDRNAPCPCGSGANAKKCRHEWGAHFPD
jgi:hypothetical protein